MDALTQEKPELVTADGSLGRCTHFSYCEEEVMDGPYLGPSDPGHPLPPKAKKTQTVNKEEKNS